MASSSSSLGELLSQESHHQNQRQPRRSGKLKPPQSPPPLLCVDRRVRRTTARSTTSSNHSSSSKACSLPPADESAAGDAALRAVVSILSGYAGRFLSDAAFRRRVRDKCSTCVAVAVGKGAARSALADLECGVKSVQRLAEEAFPGGLVGDSNIRSLRNSVRLLTAVASLNSPGSRGGGDGHGRTPGSPNSHLSACAQLYLAFVHKMERNDRLSAMSLLQVFVDAPYLARKKLMAELWEHLLLPHLLHIKVWYNKEAGLISGWDAEDRNRRVKALHRTYSDQMDASTIQFALYYTEWLKIGGRAPPAPNISLPPKPNYLEAWGKGKMPESLSLSSINRSSRSSRVFSQRDSDTTKEHSSNGVAPSQHKSNAFRLLLCRSVPDTASIHRLQSPNKGPSVVSKVVEKRTPLTSLEGAIALISNSDKLEECEIAVHEIAKAWSDTDMHESLVTALSTPSVIEGLLQVTFTSKDEDVLESSITMLAQLVAKSEVNRQSILSSDPQLEIFLRLLKSNNLFLKAAVLLYLLKPKAKQMLSSDWIPLVLRILDYGDQLQILFDVQCCPRTAAFYFLDQLLTGFDVDRNVENSKQLVALGGLDILIRRLEMGDVWERKNCASLLARCIRADGSCRDYLVANVKKTSIVQFLLDNQLKPNGNALCLLSELACLSRTTKIVKFLQELKDDGCFNTMHVLLACLQQAPPEQQPLAAAILLQLDLLGDPLQYSIYREEAIDALLGALEYNLHCKKVQEQCRRALMLLGGRFSFLGEAKTEHWLLMRAGVNGSPSDSFRSKEITMGKDTRPEEEERITEEWFRRLSVVLLRSGNQRFLVALSNCIADGMPSLARSCLVTIAWMTSSLSSMQNASSLLALACPILAPRLFDCLRYDKAQEDRVLASLSLFNFVRHPDCLPKLLPLEKEVMGSLQDLAQITWTAKELLFTCCS